MDTYMGDVIEEEGDAVEVRPQRAHQTRRRRRHMQRAQEAAQDEQELEYNRWLSNKVLEKCNDEDLELVFPGGRGRSFMQIISWGKEKSSHGSSSSY
ncbi:hypothetical protein ZWY2020_041121 [Hordeum vulgare]|nr:hypothetical protein ZWY2020_041121 [Hordeum vulgare]